MFKSNILLIIMSMIVVFPFFLFFSVSHILFMNFISVLLTFMFVVSLLNMSFSFIFFVLVEISEMATFLGLFFSNNSLVMLGIFMKIGVLLTIMYKNNMIDGQSMIDWLCWSTMTNFSTLMVINSFLELFSLSILLILALFHIFLFFALMWGNLTVSIFSSLGSIMQWIMSSQVSILLLIIMSLLYLFTMIKTMSNKVPSSVIFFFIFASFPLTPIFILKILMLSSIKNFSFLMLFLLIITSLQNIIMFDCFMKSIESMPFQKMSLTLLMTSIIILLISMN